MSAEATSLVWEFSKHTGSHLVIMLAIARKVEARKKPFKAPMGKGELKKATRLSERRARKVVGEILAQNDELTLTKEVGKNGENIYQITIYGK